MDTTQHSADRFSAEGRAETGIGPRFLHPLIASVVLLFYAGWLMRYFPERDAPGLVSLGFKSVMAMMAILGLFLVTPMRDGEHRAYGPLFSGLLLVAVAFFTDSAAELVRTTPTAKLLGERLALLVGFALVLRGLWLWTRHTLMTNAELKRQAITDELTGVFNRRYGMHELDRMAAVAKRHPQSLLSAIVFDVDHFKRINDAHGHEEGDRVLTAVAHQVQSELRTEDTLVRSGGEEFLVMLPLTDREGALNLAERLRSAVKRVEFGQQQHVTASFGVDAFAPGETVNRFLKRLDQAMYRSKHDGRDRVTLASSVMTTDPELS